MREWLLANFEVEILEGVEHIKFLMPNGRVRYAPVDFVVTFFVNSCVPPTEASLKACDPDNTTGWHENINAWVAAGIIN